jgi:hypothetical protein
MVGWLLAGCTSRSPAADPTPAGTPSAATPTASVSVPARVPVVDLVLAQYTAFWKTITPAAQAPASRRRAILAPVAADPELSRLLRGLVAAEAVGEGQYGVEVPRARVTNVRGATADVVDCQDASHAGKTNRRTGKPITRGVARNPVKATLRRGADGIWRVATVEFRGGTC